ncbi:hypothetical protein JCM10213_002011 [Rhodosporidiobolus nylandii]
MSALLPLAASQAVPPSPADVNSALAQSAFPPFQPQAPGPNVAAEWQQLVQHAREAARAQIEEERAAEEPRAGGGERTQREEGGIKVVRETFYVPLEMPESGMKGGLAAAAGQAAQAAAGLVGGTAPPAEAANIVQTVGKLKALRPLFTYAIHHPLRFLYRYALLPLLYSVFYLLSLAYNLLIYILAAALSPLHLVLSVLLSPLTSFFNLNLALLPLWATLGGAILAGGGIGTLAGLVAGRTTREIIDGAVGEAKRVLVWVGVLEREEPPAPPAPAKVSATGGFSGEAQLETIGQIFGSSRARARAQAAAGKGKQKQRESSPDTEDDLAASAGRFYQITPSLPPAPSATDAPTRPHFPSFRSPHIPPAPAASAGEHPDPPSEELDPHSRVGEGGRGRTSEKKPATAAKVGGWRGREAVW